MAWLDDDQLHDWRSLMSLVAALPAALDAQLKRDAGVNGFEYHVLAALSEAPDRTLQLSDLAHLSRGSLSRLSHAVTRLERDGWLTRTVVHRRRGRPAGRGPAHRGRLGQDPRDAPGHVREARRLVVDVLSDDELRALGSAARKVARAAGIDLEACDGAGTAPCPPADGRRRRRRRGGRPGRGRARRRPVCRTSSGSPIRSAASCASVLSSACSAGSVGLHQPHDPRVVAEVVVAQLGVAVEAELWITVRENDFTRKSVSR